MRSAFGSAVTGAVALFATVVTTRAQETEERYWRTRMGPSVLTIEQETERASKPGSEFTECASGCPAMVVVPAGSFKMGSPATEADRSPNEGPQHEVTIAKPFAVGSLRRGRSVPRVGRQRMGEWRSSGHQCGLERGGTVRGMARQDEGEAVSAAVGGRVGVSYPGRHDDAVFVRRRRLQARPLCLVLQERRSEDAGGR